MTPFTHEESRMGRSVAATHAADSESPRRPYCAAWAPPVALARPPSTTFADESAAEGPSYRQLVVSVWSISMRGLLRALNAARRCPATRRRNARRTVMPRAIAAKSWHDRRREILQAIEGCRVIAGGSIKKQFCRIARWRAHGRAPHRRSAITSGTISSGLRKRSSL